MSAIKTFLSRKKDVAPACMMPISGGANNMMQADACFIDIMALSIIELFQSQGCKSCLPVVPMIHEAVNNPNQLLLTYNVTYWDQSGWKDTFGNPQWDQRQRAYVMKWGRNGIYTPQIVVNGVSDGIGSRQGEIQEIVMNAMDSRNQMNWTVEIEKINAELKITSNQFEAETHDVLIVKYDSMQQEIKIGKGPNKGKKMMHRNLVKEVMKVGEWNGGEAMIPLPEMMGNRFERVVILQAESGGAIVAALKL